MTVAELIERLKAFDGNLPVCGSDYEEGFYPITDARLYLEDRVVLG
jgi:hypothetical protein